MGKLVLRLLALGVAGLGCLIGWLLWGPILHWIWRQFPQDASWYGFVKAGAVVLVGWGGGIAFPFIALCLALYFLVQSL